MATVNLDNMQFYNHTFTTPVFRRRGFASLSVDPPPTVAPCFNEGSATLEPYEEPDSTTSDSENSSFPPVEEVIHRVLRKEYSMAKPWSKLTDSIGKSQERPVVIDDNEPDGIQDTSSSSNSNTDSASREGSLCTTPTSLSSPQSILETDDYGFDNDVILDGDNIGWGVCSADAEQHKAAPNRPTPSNLNTSDLEKREQTQLQCQELEGRAEDIEGEKERGSEHDRDGGGDSHYSNKNYNSGDDDVAEDSNKDARPAKRQRPSPSHSDPTPNYSYKHFLHRPRDRRSRSQSRVQRRSHIAPVQSQVERPSSLMQNNDWRTSQTSETNSSLGDEEALSNTSAVYQEWPMRGFFKLITIGNEVRYGMEFSLEDAQQLCAAAFPLHTSSAGSNASLSARPTRPAQPFSVCNRADNASGATQSRNKRPRFTADEDAKLVDLKEGRGWSWEDIQREFPGRSTGSLQVRYSTRLKEKTMRREKGDTG